MGPASATDTPDKTDTIAIINIFKYKINSYEIQYNEPLYQGYNGFSIANPYLVLSSQDVSWMLNEQVENSLSIATTDYMLTTALSAKYYFTPDYEVELPEEYAQQTNIPAEADTQLQKAVEVLSEKNI